MFSRLLSGLASPGSRSFIKTGAKLIVGTSLVGWAGYEAVFDVKAGHRAVMFNRIWGVKEKTFGEGTHFMFPFLEWPIIYDVRTRPRTVGSLTGSRDLQMVNIRLRVLSRPDTKNLPDIFKSLGTDYDERVLPSIVNEVLKQVVAQFSAAELLTMREQVSRRIKESLTLRAADFHLILEDVSIIDLTFGAEFTAAVEQKQVAQQEAERAKWLVERAMQDKRSIVIKAQGEARSAEMVGKAIQNNPGFIHLRRLEAARDIADTISKSRNRVYLESDSLLLNLLSASGSNVQFNQSPVQEPVVKAAPAPQIVEA